MTDETMPPMPPLDPVTSGPILRLMLAAKGHELTKVRAVEAWPVFREFAKLRNTADKDAIGFQMHAASDPDFDTVSFCALCRQMEDIHGEPPSDDDEGHDDEASPYTTSRLMVLQFTYNNPDMPEDVEVWSDQYADVDSFLDALEVLPQFHFFLEEEHDQCTIFYEFSNPDDDAFDEDDDEYNEE